MDFLDYKKKLDQGLSHGFMILAIGSCAVKYQGRAASKLSEGERLLVIKGDGTFLVHQSKGMKAINYQGPGAVISAQVLEQEGKEELVVKAERQKPKEVIEVHFHSIDFLQSFPMRDDEKLKVFGTEKELSDLLAQDLNLVEEGLKALKREKDVRKGTIDIIAEDKEGKLVVIEVKRRNAELAAVTQLKRYVEELEQRKDMKRRVRGMICAPGISEGALKMLEKEGLEFYKLDYEIHNPSAKINGIQKKQKELGDFQ
jgi:RecB family endonuclease NucS